MMLYYMELSYEQERLQRQLHDGLSPPITTAPHHQQQQQRRRKLGAARENGRGSTAVPSAGAAAEHRLLAPAHDDGANAGGGEGAEAAWWALCDVDGRIKGALTELLNSEGVRADGRARGWVMQRLLEVEHEMRRLRARRRHGGDGRRSADGEGREAERGVERGGADS
jgi:hypothetical protein